MRDHENFLCEVENYVKNHPEVSAYVSDAVARGVACRLKEVSERAADMEVALAVMVAKRYNKREVLVLDKLKKWKDKSSLRWDDTISMLEGVVK